jgi:hypothetical protein
MVDNTCCVLRLQIALMLLLISGHWLPVATSTRNLVETESRSGQGSSTSSQPQPQPQPQPQYHHQHATQKQSTGSEPSVDVKVAVQSLIARRLGEGYVAAFDLGFIQPDPATGHGMFTIGAAGGISGGCSMNDGYRPDADASADSKRTTWSSHSHSSAVLPAVRLCGSSGVALSAALGFYLKSINCSWSWDRGPSGWVMGPLPQPESLVAPTVTRRKVRIGENPVFASEK